MPQAYYDKDTVTDELVDCILKPGLQPGAAQARALPPPALHSWPDTAPVAGGQCAAHTRSHDTSPLPHATLAPQVFLDFISYSGGPLPEDLLPLLDREKCPVLIAWGEKDPWEPMNEGRKLYGGQPCVEDFIVLKNVG